MQSFIAIHNTDKGPSFSNFDSVQAAKGHLQSLIRSQQVGTSDTLAIVRTSDDSIVYFKKRNNTVASLNTAIRQPETGLRLTAHSLYQTAKDRLTLAFTALNNVVSRR